MKIDREVIDELKKIKNALNYMHDKLKENKTDTKFNEEYSFIFKSLDNIQSKSEVIE